MIRKILLSLLLLVVLVTGAGALFPQEIVAFGLMVERARNGLSYETIVVDGETWHYLDGGAQDAPTVLMVHGFGADKDNWLRFSGELQDRYRLVAPDLPGFGQSARHRDWDYTPPRQVERLHQFVNALGIDKFHMIGNSMGGLITALYAHKYPQQVESIGLFNNAGITPPVDNEMTLALKRGDNPLLLQSVEDFDRLLNFVMEKRPFIPPLAKKVIAERTLGQREFNAHIYQQYKANRASGLEPVIASLKVPTLILWGRQDRVIDVSVVNIMRALKPDAKVTILDDTGHMPMIERPALTAERYVDFVSRHD